VTGEALNTRAWEGAVPSLPLDDEHLPLFTVGQVSGMLAVQQAFLRRLDQLGVVTPSRSAGGQRRYSRHEITVVQYVVQLADEGMTLAGIRRILEVEARVLEMRREYAQLRREHAELAEEAAALRAQLRDLDADR
jgi:MerR family transcriptional regulator/heat shock protein HspR